MNCCSFVSALRGEENGSQCQVLVLAYLIRGAPVVRPEGWMDGVVLD
jgi:hypothetical protein